jgi:tRNA modification GTPase
VLADLKSTLAGFAQGERLRNGFEVVLVGAPNAGKSTFLNACAGREAAITSPTPGTTRDVLEVSMDLEGLPVMLVDVAGIREPLDDVERIGVERAFERARGADLRLFLSAPDAPLPGLAQGLMQPDDIRIAAKADLGVDGDGVAMVASEGRGVSEVLRLVAAVLGERVAVSGLIGHIRHREAITLAITRVETAMTGVGVMPVELLAEEVRGAVGALESLTGRVGAEELLGTIFGRFCLGK